MTPLSPTRCLSAQSKWPEFVISRGVGLACAAKCEGGMRAAGGVCVEGVEGVVWREEGVVAGGWLVKRDISSVEVRVN